MPGHRGILSALAVAIALSLVGWAGPASATGAPTSTPTSASTPASTPAPGRATSAVTPTLRVTPSTGLVDGQTISVVGTGTTPGSTFVFVECDPVALQIFGGQLPPEDNPNDGCEEQRDTVLFSDAAGVVAGTLKTEAVTATAAGTADCRTDQCFVALFALAGGPSVQIQNLTFSPSACAQPGSCVVPADWSPSSAARVAGLAAAPISTVHRPVTRTLWAAPAGDLTAPGSVSGPYGGGSLATPTPVDPPAPVSGEGLVRLALAAPGTAWSTASPRSAVVDVSVDGGPAQQLVLFRGDKPFVYAVFTGPLTTGTHTVSITPDAGLSVMDGHALHVQVLSAGLEVVTPDNPSFLAYAYAPVMYGRSTSALHDTPLVDYAGSTALAGGSVRLSYTVVWSH